HTCEPGWRWSPPPLVDYDLWCVLAGEGEMRLLGQSYALRARSSFVVPPGSEPVATQNPAHRLQVFAVHFEPLGDDSDPLTAERFPLPPQGVVLRDGGFFEAMARRCAACAERLDLDNGGSGSPLPERQMVLLVEQMLLHLWDEAARPAPNPADTRIQEIGSLIRSSPGEAWDVGTQAKRACLSRSQYTRRFVRLLGVSPARYVIRCRLERASQLLSETDLGVGEIARILGYRDLFFFSRQFRGRFGVPPTALRRRDQ
ncbi:MAG: helix-turn-helix transcriptional regulator, partial [Cytophagales bacterium]|nr:helix-turn-helix transcriptional regulator [Armatimonadota bacterium]